MASSPAFAKYPDHRVDLEEKSGRVRVEFAGRAIADSERCRLVLESRHDPVLYFPREDVDMDSLVAIEHTTFCPFKGTASYWTIRVEGREAEGAVWSYGDPYDEVGDLKDFMAFYTDRVDGIREGD
jgi:uncharacterized protein (DUF427 family)